MREIKFRGYDAMGRKGWVYGDLVHNKKVTLTGLEDRVMVGGYEVIPSSVGQSTGINDCFGWRIYEKDRVLMKSKRRKSEKDPYEGCVSEVFYHQACFSLLMPDGSNMTLKRACANYELNVLQD